MRDYKTDMENRINFIKDILAKSGAKGIVYGNSGGKDSALVGILCKAACDNTLGVMMPCESKRNFDEDIRDAKEVAEQFNIETVTVDLTSTKKTICESISPVCDITHQALANIAPRIRMTALYAIAQTRDALVAGTGNRSEIYMGYFTKWGDGAYDFNPIADLTVTEIYEFLEFLKTPENIIKKAPSGGLFDGQTDEEEMGISYKAIDNYILNGKASKEETVIIEKAHNSSGHKRVLPLTYN